MQIGLKQSERVIGNHTYKVTTLGALKGRAVFALLVRLLGGAADGLKADTLGRALADLAGNLRDEDLAFLCDTFGKVSDVVLPDGREPKVSDVFDLHFAGNYLEMVQWLVFCLEVNFGSFFRGLAGTLANGVSATQAAKAK